MSKPGKLPEPKTTVVKQQDPQATQHHKNVSQFQAEHYPGTTGQSGSEPGGNAEKGK
jgi:hypothetical protein